MGPVAPHACIFLVLAAAGSSALGQAFNVDCGGNIGTPPDSTYGAGGGQPGYWNALGAPATLRDLSGAATSVMFYGGGSAFHAIPGATGNDKSLMETAFAMSPTNSVVVTNLADGQYNIYAYSWAGQFFGPRTVGFTVVNGVDTFVGSLSFGASWPGRQIEGVTFARIPVQVLPGQNYLELSIGSGHDYDLLAGIQLVPIPAPGAVVVLAGAGVLAIRRRRQS